MSKEIKEYPFEKTFDVEFDENALKKFNDLIKEKGIRHFKIESDLYGILDVVSYEEYENLQQKVEQLENIRKEAIKLCDEMLSILYHYDDRKVWEDMKDILNKESDK